MTTTNQRCRCCLENGLERHNSRWCPAYNAQVAWSKRIRRMLDNPADWRTTPVPGPTDDRTFRRSILVSGDRLGCFGSVKITEYTRRLNDFEATMHAALNSRVAEQFYKAIGR